VSRSTSPKFRRALFAQETGEVALCLLTISHPDLTEPIRLSTDPTQRLSTSTTGPVYGTASRGNGYTFVPVAVSLPEESDDSGPLASLEIDNTDLALISAIRSISNAATVKIELVLASDPDTVEIEFPDMTLTDCTYDQTRVSFSLGIDALQSEPYPGTSFLPSNFPGLF